MALGLAGCASLPATPSARALQPGDLLVAALPDSPAMAAPMAPRTSTELLATAGAMSDLLDSPAHQAPAVSGDAYARLRQLVGVLVQNPEFHLAYDDRTRTATETYLAKRGNCLSFTNLFVALARDAGLTVHYQEVDVPPDWESGGTTWVLNRHINAVVDLGLLGQQIVDFNLAEFRAAYPRRVISDNRALAHFHSNRGVEALMDGDDESAARHLSAAIRADEDLSAAWVNMGALFRRRGEAVYAEAAFLQALKRNPAETAAASNLAELHARAGRLDDGRWYRERAEFHRQQNPWYRERLGRDALARRDFVAALAEAREAMRLRPEEDAFYALAAEAAAGLGRREQAVRWLQQAEALAADRPDGQRYHRKLELLSAGS